MKRIKLYNPNGGFVVLYEDQTEGLLRKGFTVEKQKKKTINKAEVKGNG